MQKVRRTSKKYCPANCNGADSVPRKLTLAELERINREIDENKYPQLPDLVAGEDLYICGRYCDAVWKATSQYSEDPVRVVLGRLKGRWQPKGHS